MRLRLAAALLAALPAVATAQTSDSLFAAEVRAVLDSARHDELRWPMLTDVGADVRRAYEVQGWRPLWLADRTPTPAALALLTELRRAAVRGLDRDDYDADSLAARVSGVRFAPADSAVRRAARWDAGMSVAAARYATALQRGRVNPRKLFALLTIARDTVDAAQLVLALRSTDRPGPFLDQLEPPYEEYRALRRALPALRLLAQDTALVAGLPAFPARLRLGMTWAGLPALRRLLAATGDYPLAQLVPTDASRVYDSVTVQAVRAFQRRQGFSDDGVIGDSTAARLRRPVTAQVRQVELTLERWRWLPRRFTMPPIIVNLAAFRLSAFHGTSDLDSVLAMNVVVGKSIDHSTPLMADTMTHVVFRPYWDVPRSIMLKEIKPKALREPGWFAKEGYELVRDGTVLPPTRENLQQIAVGGVRVRQVPGHGNALGDMKFLLPNVEDIYLHDTPSRSLFARARRDFSHGCVRVADPKALALHVLRDRPDWTAARIDSLVAKTTPTTVRLKTPVPIYLLYGTAVADSSGMIRFFADLYGHDRTLDALLRRGYPY